MDVGHWIQVQEVIDLTHLVNTPIVVDLTVLEDEERVPANRWEEDDVHAMMALAHIYHAEHEDEVVYHAEEDEETIYGEEYEEEEEEGYEDNDSVGNYDGTNDFLSVKVWRNIHRQL